MLLYILTPNQGNLERKVSHVDQTRFMTDAYADEVERQLKLDSAERGIEGHSFGLELITQVSSQDDVHDAKFTLLIDRVEGETAFEHANGDAVYGTWARIVPGGDVFRITIVIPVDDSDIQKATVHVAPEMERVVNEFIASQDRIS